MKLVLNTIDIEEIKFSEKTTITDKVLYINRSELVELLEQDKNLSRIEVELARPGEKCRILQVIDVIEPRARIGENEGDFPGVLSKPGFAGDGCTCVLHNVAVVISEEGEVSGPSLTPIGNVIDMSGPGAEVSRYGKTHNVVIRAYPKANSSSGDYRIALKLAGLRTAVYLAKAGKSLKPDHIEVYNLPPLTELNEGKKDLPKIAYIFQVYSTSFPPLAYEPILYGDNITRLLPVIVHPNEILDGGLINPYFGMGIETYAIQNHPIIKELYSRDGRDLCFVGVIITTSHTIESDRVRSAAIAAKLAKWVLGADGVVLTKAGGGAPELDMGETAEKCEELGVRTVLVMWQLSSPIEGGVLFSIPKVDAIVSTVSPSDVITLPAVDRVIGKPVTLRDGAPVSGQLKMIRMWIQGSADQIGFSNQISVLC